MGLPDDALWLSERQLDYHRRQFETPYRSTVALGDFIARQLAGAPPPRRVLDVACGAGASIYHLSRVLPDAHWTGVDYAERYLELGRELLAAAPPPTPDAELVAGDLYRLDETLEPRSFDVVLSIQTLSWLPSYEQPLEQLLRMARPGGWIFASSLFTDSLVDADVVIRPRGSEAAYYNVYSTGRFAEECIRHGAQLVAAEDFEIDVDLEPPADGGMGTYTRRLADGSRLQFSGPLWMPWKFVAIRA